MLVLETAVKTRQKYWQAYIQLYSRSSTQCVLRARRAKTMRIHVSPPVPAINISGIFNISEKVLKYTYQHTINMLVNTTENSISFLSVINKVVNKLTFVAVLYTTLCPL